MRLLNSPQAFSSVNRFAKKHNLFGMGNFPFPLTLKTGGLHYVSKSTEKTLSDLKAAAQKGLSNIDVNALKDKAAEATSIMVEKAGELKDAAADVKDDIAAKLTELDRMLQESVTEYNDAYTIMNDKGVQLYIERCRSLDSISFVESLINSIANRPKSFDAEFEEISVYRKKFTESRDFADRELQETRKAAAGAGAGLVAGASVAVMTPTAAMWVATTWENTPGQSHNFISGRSAVGGALALGARPGWFDSSHSDQSPSEICDFRGTFL